MKKITFCTFLFFTLLTANAQSVNNSHPTSAPVEMVELKETAFDFGKIQQSRPVYHNFDIRNTGKELLKLENVQTSCGCTTPEWNPKPVEPGNITSVKVGYNAASEGPFSKTITIIYNGNQTKTVVITGTVYKAPATSAPVNPSVTLLKQKNQ